MGYSLIIGEATLEYIPEDSFVGVRAELVEKPDAPAYGEPTDYSNGRWPSYTGWSEFCRFVGLYALFFDKEEGLLRNHPGASPITQNTKAAIDSAYARFKDKYPNAQAGYAENLHASQEEWPSENCHLVRLEWLKYWVDWSLTYCQHPVFYNS